MPSSELAIRPYGDGDREAIPAVHEAAFHASGMEFVAVWLPARNFATSPRRM